MLAVKEHSAEFVPFRKVARQIDECLAQINFLRVSGRTQEVCMKEEELEELREEIKIIKRRICK